MKTKQIIFLWAVSIIILTVGMSWSQYYGYQKGFQDGFVTQQSTNINEE